VKDSGPLSGGCQLAILILAVLAAETTVRRHPSTGGVEGARHSAP
jgi:hypothetical protein